MALFENVAIALLFTVSMIAANQPAEFLSQSPQPYRSFTDRQDKFNGNYNVAMDNLNGGNSKRLRSGSSPSVMGSNSENYSSYRSQLGGNNARQQPSTSRQYEVPSVDYDQSVNRNGDSASYYSEQSPSSFIQTPASK
jgi:hypothetical protein